LSYKWTGRPHHGQASKKLELQKTNVHRVKGLRSPWISLTETRDCMTSLFRKAGP